jgi:uncharacterized protein (DUF2384 family)
MAVVDERQLWLQIRQAMLMVADAIEKAQGIEPRTSQLRREEKERIKQQRQQDRNNG